MMEPDHDRPGSSAAPFHPSSIPPSPRPSVASRASRSSLRREAGYPRPPSAAHSNPQSPPPAPEYASRPPEDGHDDDEPEFTPIFTLVTTQSSITPHRQSLHHPTVHYMFADDDPELLNDALARHHRGEPIDLREYHDHEEERHRRKHTKRWQERAAILDLVESGTSPEDGITYRVSSASSLSPDWAVTSARLTPMQTVSETSTSSPPSSAPGALVLRIEGIGMEAVASSSVTADKAEVPLTSPNLTRQRQLQLGYLPMGDDYAVLVQEFDKRMEVMRKVLEAGTEREREMEAELHGARDAMEEQASGSGQQAASAEAGDQPGSRAGSRAGPEQTVGSHQ